MYQVLLVDDEPIILLGIRNMINWEDTSFDLCGTVRNGQEAIDFIEKHPVDMVLTDLKMPIMDGITLIKTLKEKNRQLPILVLSNYSDFELVREALTQGATDYILKVNLTDKSLIQQLEKMAKTLEDNQRDLLQKQRQAQLFEQQSKEVIQSRIHSFFLDTHHHPDELQNYLQSHDGFTPPFFTFTIFFTDEDMKNGKLYRVLPHIESLITATFSPSEVIISALHQNEILCFTSLTVLNTQQLLDMLRHLQKQLATYFSASPLISFFHEAANLNSIRQAYYQCITSREICFYQPNTVLVDASSYSSQPVKDGFLDEFVSILLEKMRTGDPSELDVLIHSTLHKWGNLPLKPSDLKQLCSNVIDYIRYSCAISELPESIHEQQKAIYSACNLTQLETNFTNALQLLHELNGKPFEKYKCEIQSTLMYLHTHYNEKITLDSIATAVCLNRSYLCRLFKKELNVSIFSYLNKLRMEKAAEIISNNSNVFVKEIAEQVGIDEPFYFTRKFKEYHGISPREYAAKHQNAFTEK